MGDQGYRIRLTFSSLCIETVNTSCKGWRVARSEIPSWKPSFLIIGFIFCHPALLSFTAFQLESWIAFFSLAFSSPFNSFLGLCTHTCIYPLAFFLLAGVTFPSWKEFWPRRLHLVYVTHRTSMQQGQVAIRKISGCSSAHWKCHLLSHRLSLGCHLYIHPTYCSFFIDKQ